MAEKEIGVMTEGEINEEFDKIMMGLPSYVFCKLFREEYYRKKFLGNYNDWRVVDKTQALADIRQIMKSTQRDVGAYVVVGIVDLLQSIGGIFNLKSEDIEPMDELELEEAINTIKTISERYVRENGGNRL